MSGSSLDDDVARTAADLLFGTILINYYGRKRDALREQGRWAFALDCDEAVRELRAELESRYPECFSTSDSRDGAAS